jgi:hypothetical protein
MIQLADVTKRLLDFGYTVSEIHYKHIEFEIELILDYVVNYCNFSSVDMIPPILKNRIIDRICSEYLMKQKNSGNLESFDYSLAVKTIKEGDTQIQFGTENDGDTPESRFDKWVDYMQRGFDKWISLHRRIKW